MSYSNISEIEHAYVDKLNLNSIPGIEEVCDSIDAFNNFINKHFPDSLQNGSLSIHQHPNCKYTGSKKIIKVSTVYKFTFNSAYGETTITFNPQHTKTPITISYNTPTIHSIEEIWKIVNLAQIADKIINLPNKSKGFNKTIGWTIKKELEVNYEDVGIKLTKPNGKKRKKEELAKEFFVTLLSFCDKGVFWSSVPLTNDLMGLLCKAHFFSKSTIADFDGYIYNFNSSNPYSYYDSENSDFIRGSCPYTEIQKSLNHYNIVYKNNAYASCVPLKDIQSDVMFYNKYGEQVVNNDFCNICSYQLYCETNKADNTSLRSEYKIPKSYLSQFR